MKLKGAIKSNIAIKYAHALFEVAYSEGGKERIDQIIADIETINQILGQGKDSIFEFLSSPLINIDQKLQILGKIPESEINSSLYRLVTLLVERNRLKFINDIFYLLKKMRDEIDDVVHGEIFVASNVDNKVKEHIISNLHKIIGKKIEAKFIEDKNILAGFVTYVSSYYIDYSLSSQLKRLENELKRG